MLLLIRSSSYRAFSALVLFTEHTQGVCPGLSPFAPWALRQKLGQQANFSFHQLCAKLLPLSEKSQTRIESIQRNQGGSVMITNPESDPMQPNDPLPQPGNPRTPPITPHDPIEPDPGNPEPTPEPIPLPPDTNPSPAAPVREPDQPMPIGDPPPIEPTRM
jgi:hypothetical protein